MTLSRRRWLWLLALLPLAIGFARLRFDVEVLNLLPPELPAVQGLKLYQENFLNAKELIITIRGTDAEATEEAGRSLAATLRQATNLISAATWQPPWLERPGEAAELIAYLWLNQPSAAFTDLTHRVAPGQLDRTLDETRAALATSLSPEDLAVRGYDPFGLTRLPEAASASMPGLGSGQELFASSDGTFRLLFVQSRHDLADFRTCVSWLKAVREIIQDWQGGEPSRAGLQVRFTGRPAFVAEISSGMEKDMTGPSAGTLAVIALLFYFTHRRWKPLLWLLLLLLLILAATLALGGLVFGALNVVSLGFAAILLGLAEDFGIVLYQESRSHPAWTAAEIRRVAAPGIFWSAITTSGAFLLLNLSGLPGLGQLGSLVALGIILAALVMVYFFLPPLMPQGRSAEFVSPAEKLDEFRKLNGADSVPPGRTTTLMWILTALLILGGSVSLLLSPPRFDRSPNSLRPRNSAAHAALDEIKIAMQRPQEPQWVVVQGRTESEVANRLQQITPILERARKHGWIAGVTLPTQLWPQPENQKMNKPAAAAFAQEFPRIRDAALAHGFTQDSLGMTEQILQTWSRAAASPDTFWPDNDSSRWVLEKLTARRSGRFLAIGLIYPSTNSLALARSGLKDLARELPREGVLLSGWDLLGAAIAQMIVEEMPRVLIPIVLIVVLALWLAFRSCAEVGLSLVTLAVSGLLLVLIMNLLGWTWNMMNLMAVPLLLGMGVDFGIHTQLALRRDHGDLKRVRASIGRALLLAGSTTVAGFASLAFSSNAGLASLGRICACGIVCSMVTAIYLLPVWWQAMTREAPSRPAPEDLIST